MCTVVVRHARNEPVRILALRDEFVDRDFDEPGRWWPEHPQFVGGRDRAAGGTWCAADPVIGAVALLVNRTERFTGTPSRGLLPLAALAHGAGWTGTVDHRTMASFNLVLASPGATVVWTWDAVSLRRTDLAVGTHLVTSQGIDAADAKTRRFGPSLVATGPTGWPGIVTGCTPEAEDSALVVRRDYEGRRYATVFGQDITATPGSLTIASTRTPWLTDTWQERRWVPLKRTPADTA